MPISQYDKEFGGKEGAATKALSAIQEEYGSDKGERVFYAKKNRNKKAGKVTSPLVARAMRG